MWSIPRSCCECRAFLVFCIAFQHVNYYCFMRITEAMSSFLQRVGVFASTDSQSLNLDGISDPLASLPSIFTAKAVTSLLLLMIVSYDSRLTPPFLRVVPVSLTESRVLLSDLPRRRGQPKNEATI